MTYGTLSVLDTLAASAAGTIAEYGENNAFDQVSIALAAHDALLADIVLAIAEPTSDRLRMAGGSSAMVAQELDEFGRPAPQKITAGAPLGFPLRRIGNALQWTRDWMQTKTPAELAAQINAIMIADRDMIMRDIKRALFLSSNYSFVDRLTDGMTLAVKRLANADSFAIPDGPDGTSFDSSTHTHYAARVGSLAASDITAVITNVRHHYDMGEIRLYINSAQESAVRGFTSNFFPYHDPRLILGSSTTHAGGTLDVANINHRAIGIFDEAEVWVAPWVPASYMAAVITGPGIRAPLAFRTRNGQGVGQLELVGDHDSYPLRANMWKRDYGVGVQNRVAGAILYVGDTSFADPTIN